MPVSRKYIIAASLIAVVSACAKQGSPSGGPRDETPPAVLSTTPANGATGFTGNTITITFNEFVVLDKITEKFMISPPVSKRPDITLRGKNLVITIDEQLRDSTTYTLYFQDAIRDLNESNILENYQFVFSTGDFVDSLSIAGMVYDAYSLEVPERMLVMLHSNLSDTAPMTTIPDYISMTGQSGYFTVSNVKAGTYRIFALNDLNSNRKYEPGEEQFAFSTPTVVIDPERNSTPPEEEDVHDHISDSSAVHTHLRDPDVTLYSFLSPATRYYLSSSSRKEARLLEYILSRPPDTMAFGFEIPGALPGNIFTETTAKKDTIRIWLKDSTDYNQPTLQTVVTFPFTATSDSVVYRTDTVPMRFVQPRAPRSGTRESFVSLVADATRSGIPPGRDITITPGVPLESVDFSLFSITAEGDSLAVPLPFTPEFNPVVPREIILRHSLDEGAGYIIKILPGAVRSVYGETNDTATFSFRIRARSTYGTLRVRLSDYEGDVVLQLLDTREKVIMAKSLTSPGSAEFSFVENGTYRLKVICDENANGEWTPGDFLTGKQPEKVSFFPEELEVKSNWDLEQDWSIGIVNRKAETLRLKKPQQR